MTTSIELEGGVPALVRRATPGSASERLLAEVALLRRIDHPGTVRVLRCDARGDGGTTVVTAFVGGGSLADWAGDALDPADVAAIGAKVASTLAVAHGRGIAHGSISARHVLIDADGRPLVCGWTGTTESSPAGATATAADDVAGLGWLLDELLDRGRGGPDEVALRAVTARATTAEPTGRPAMAALAGSLTDLAAERDPGPTWGAPTSPSLHHRHRAARRRRGGWIPAVVLAAIVLTAAALVATTPPAPAPLSPSLPTHDPADAPRLVPTPEGGSTVAPTPDAPPDDLATAPTTSVHGPHLPPERARPATNPDGAPAATPGSGWESDPSSWQEVGLPECVPADHAGRCLGPVHLRAGSVSAGGRTWSVGEPDDVPAIGRWACGGRATPAVLQRSSGAVWVFPRWAGRGEAVTARHVGVVPDAVKLVAVRRADTPCDGIGVVRADGSGVVLDPR